MSTPKERPILFSAPMVRAILDGSKTQTRRAVKPQMPQNCSIPSPWRDDFSVGGHDYRCPYGAPGDRLWVRETWQRNLGTDGGIIYRADHGQAQSVYKADLATGKWAIAVSGWCSSSSMPKRFSRILLEITDVRVQRLQDISEDDAEAEGVDVIGCAFPRGGSIRIDAFARLWESINGAGSWDANPWLWAITFRRLQP